ncbi:MAG: NifB/NifX family molybdenum-iron cluster-binding protein [Candidatus Lokiarchaeota archaeon]
MTKIIGIPSSGPDLMDDISEHFGHCKYFIGVEIDGNSDMKKVFTIENSGHTGCMEPVMNMKERNVTDMIISGIGGRPYMGFTQLGINLYQGVQGSLKDNVDLLLSNKLKPLGGPSCSHH